MKKKEAINSKRKIIITVIMCLIILLLAFLSIYLLDRQIVDKHNNGNIQTSKTVDKKSEYKVDVNNLLINHDKIRIEVDPSLKKAEVFYDDKSVEEVNSTVNITQFTIWKIKNKYFIQSFTEAQGDFGNSLSVITNEGKLLKHEPESTFYIENDRYYLSKSYDVSACPLCSITKELNITNDSINYTKTTISALFDDLHYIMNQERLSGIDEDLEIKIFKEEVDGSLLNMKLQKGKGSIIFKVYINDKYILDAYCDTDFEILNNKYIRVVGEDIKLFDKNGNEINAEDVGIDNSDIYHFHKYFKNKESLDPERKETYKDITIDIRYETDKSKPGRIVYINEKEALKCYGVYDVYYIDGKVIIVDYGTYIFKNMYIYNADGTLYKEYSKLDEVNSIGTGVVSKRAIYIKGNKIILEGSNDSGSSKGTYEIEYMGNGEFSDIKNITYQSID